MRLRLFRHRRLVCHGIGKIREQAQMVGQNLCTEADRISCGDGRIGPDFERKLVIVCHVAHTGVLHGVVHLVDRRVNRIDGNRSDGHVGRLVLIGRDVSAAVAQRDFHVEGGVGTQRADMKVRIENLDLAVCLDVAGGDFTFAGGVDEDGLRALAVQSGNDLLYIQNDLRNVFLDAGNRGELVLHTRDLDRGRGCAGQGGKKNPAQRVAEGGAVASFQRFDDIFAVGAILRGIHTLNTRLFNFYHE